MARMRLRAGVTAVVVIAFVCVSGWAISGSSHSGRSALGQALDLLPADTRITSLTDWAQIREVTGYDEEADGVDALTGDAFERDLSARSIMADSVGQMEQAYGWSVADLSWEAYGQATDGSVLVAGMGDGLDADTVTGELDGLGYGEADGIWSVTSDSVASVVPGVDNAFSHIAVLTDRRIIVMSDQRDYLEQVLAGDRRRDTLAGVTAARQAAGPLNGAVSVLLEAGKDACDSASLAGQPDDVRSQARNAVEPLGTLAAVEYAGRAVLDDGDAQQLRFSMTFGSAAVAGEQRAIRERLTTGPFIGRTGAIGDVLELVKAHTDGSTATLEFDFDRTKGSFMSGSGPILFAACSV